MRAHAPAFRRPSRCPAVLLGVIGGTLGWAAALGAAPAAAGGAGTVTRTDLDAPAPVYERARGVIREELDPVLAPDGSGLPHELWRGLSAQALAESLGQLTLPSPSATLNGLWRRLIASDSAADAASPARFTALRVEALDQAGLIDEAAAVLAKSPAASREPLLMALTARSEIGLGNSERGCEIAQSLTAARKSLPKPMQGDLLLIAGYCALARGDTAGAALQASLIRDLELASGTSADLLDAVAAGLAPEIPKEAKLSLLDYRIGALKGGFSPGDLVPHASPALLAGLAHDPRTAADIRLAAGEAAAALNILPPTDLAPLYRARGAGGDAGSIERASLFTASEAERMPLRKARLVRSFLDEARRIGLYGPALRLMADATASIAPIPEVGWFAETAIEVSLVSGNFEAARRWAAFTDSADSLNPAAPQPLAHWLALVDLADASAAAGSGRGLAAVAAMAQAGRFEATLVNRLTTVLDALALPVPATLWELAGRAPQPAGGHLPDTGVLTELAEASRKKEFGRTVLLVMRTLGPAGAEGAHLIALGDSLRALKRAGLEGEARQLAVEGLLAAWPRAVSQ